MFKKLWRNCRIAASSIFYGMRGGDAVIEAPPSTDGSEIIITKETGSVAQDLLGGKINERVQELRDKYYRVFREANKYKTELVPILDEDGEVLSFNEVTVRKKTNAELIEHPKVYESEGYSLRVIQDNAAIEPSLEEDLKSLFNGEIKITNPDFHTTLEIIRDDKFIPRFKIEKLITKIVARNSNTDKTKARVDLYFPMFPQQFNPIEGAVVNVIKTLYESEHYKSDLTDALGFKWITYRAWNSDDIMLFEYNNANLIEIVKFNGFYVLSYECTIVNDEFDLIEKYKTKSLDAKYAEEALKKDNVDISAAKRRIEKEKQHENSN